MRKKTLCLICVVALLIIMALPTFAMTNDSESIFSVNNFYIGTDAFELTGTLFRNIDGTHRLYYAGSSLQNINDYNDPLSETITVYLKTVMNAYYSNGTTGNPISRFTQCTFTNIRQGYNNTTDAIDFFIDNTSITAISAQHIVTNYSQTYNYASTSTEASGYNFYSIGDTYYMISIDYLPGLDF